MVSCPYEHLPHLKACCYCLPLRVGCLMVGWWMVIQGLLVMCGFMELEGEDEQRRSNFANGFVGTFLFLMGVLVIGAVAEAKPLWLDAAALMILVCSVSLVVNSSFTHIRRGGNRTLYLMSALLGLVLYFDVVLLSYATELRAQERREREVSARLSPQPTRRSPPATTVAAETPNESATV